MKKYINQKGFTLLELLVVISIIGILIVLAAASYSVAQQRGRDARRRGDLKTVQNAFEQYYANSTNQQYAGTCAGMAGALPGGLPTDPQGGAYPCTSSTTSYCACAQLDNTTGGNSSDSSCSWSVSGAYFCVSNLQ